MITKQDLLEAIAECQGTRSPNANTAIKLAAFYTILDHMDEPKIEPVQNSYSYAAPADGTIDYEGDSEFARAVDGKPTKEVIAVFDELMDTIKMMNERLYYGVLRKL